MALMELSMLFMLLIGNIMIQTQDYEQVDGGRELLVHTEKGSSNVDYIIDKTYFKNKRHIL